MNYNTQEQAQTLIFKILDNSIQQLYFYYQYTDLICYNIEHINTITKSIYLTLQKAKTANISVNPVKLEIISQLSKTILTEIRKNT